jgi:SAM-dependent methyltransferase
VGCSGGGHRAKSAFAHPKPAFFKRNALMDPVRISGTEGYAEQAETLVSQYDGISFAAVHKDVLHLIPRAPCRALDIGAGTGRDAAALADMGHRVVAVEPVAEFRARAAVLHPSPHIEWLDDHLPELAQLSGRRENFDLILLSAVWMHLDKEQRRQAMPRVASLLLETGVLVLSLRHGPIPPGRRMFDVTTDETIQLASVEGLRLELRLDNQPAALGTKGVSWTRLAFSKTPLTS